MRALRPLIILLLIRGSSAWAQDFFQQSPGPLSESHADLEGQDNCGKCHTSGKALSSDKCLGCHVEQKAKIDGGRGFHSSAKVKGKDCWSCHVEHKGKSWDEMGWTALGGRDQFSHDWTDFPLHGKHAATRCESCHQRTSARQGLRLFLGEASLCGSCHKKDQPHHFTGGERELMKCDRCHSDVAFQPPRRPLDFDHNDRRQTTFPLEGSHVDVACAKCHPKAVFRLEKQASCAGCHPDPHKGTIFEKKSCETCHSAKAEKLSQFSFDHGRQTKFALTGKHASLACVTCHPAGQAKKPDRACESCHQKEDKHRGRFAAFGAPEPACGTCHPTTTWKPTVFNHGKQTHFVLTGKHAQVGCRNCHRGKDPSEFEKFDWKTVGCMGCHQHTNVHQKKFKDTDCQGCHKPPGTIEKSTMTAAALDDKAHGPNARFPLSAAHAKVACEMCHKGDQWKGLSIDCAPACHEDSLHKGSLGKTCTKCHEGGTWKASRFDHQATSYPLIGQHLKVECVSCHPQRKFKPTANTCAAAGCHAKDDVHEGALGKACEKCHSETGDTTFDHNKMAAFRLENAHLSTPCASCHPTLAFKPRPKDCFGCHPEPDVHKGKFGTACASCHTTADWKSQTPVHDVGNFSLAGAHDGVACDRCHGKDMRKLAGTGNLCVSCHRVDDIHAGSLGPKCGQCHMQWAFAPARFEHLTVGCNLRGQHRVLPCFDCHRSGNFGGLSPACFGCHRDDALTRGQASGTDHRMQFDCGDCHNLNFFSGAPAAAAHTNSVCR